MPLLLLFVLFVVFDFVTLFVVGSQIGGLATLALLLLTSVIGVYLVRRVGMATLRRAQQRFANGELPSGELLSGIALIAGGILLIAPGFLSDMLGLACLIPSSRQWLGRLVGRANVQVSGFQYRRQESNPDEIDDWQTETRHHQSNTSDANDGDHRQDTLEGDFIPRDDTRR